MDKKSTQIIPFMDEKIKMVYMVGKIHVKSCNQGIRYTTKRWYKINGRRRKRNKRQGSCSYIEVFQTDSLKLTYTLPRRHALFLDCRRRKNEGQWVWRHKSSMGETINTIWSNHRGFKYNNTQEFFKVKTIWRKNRLWRTDCRSSVILHV